MGVLAALAGAGAVRAQQQFPTPPTAQHPVFRAGATLVAVDIYPTKDGQIVEGLTPADFEVKEDGAPQSLEFFEFLKFEQLPIDSERRDPPTAEEGERLVGDPRHRAFVAYFDTYHLTPYGTQKMRTPVIDFLNRTIGSTDYFAAMNPDTVPAAITFGQRTDTIEKEVELYWPLAATADAGTSPMSAHEQFLQGCYISRWPQIARNQAIIATLLRRYRMNLVLTSLNGMVEKIGTIREGRTNVLLFADGWALEGPDATLPANIWGVHPTPGVAGGRLTPNGANKNIPDTDQCDAELQRLASMDFATGFRVLREEAVKKNVVFNTVSPAGLEAYDDNLMRSGPGDFNRVQSNLDNLRTLASTTNGQSIVGTNDIASPMRQLANTVSAYYLVGYYTTNTKLDNKFRTIDVKVKTPGIHVSARRGYVAGKQPLTTRTVDGDAAKPSSEAATLGALAMLDQTDTLYVSGTSAGAEAVVVAEIPATRAADFAKGAPVSVTLAGGAAPATGTLAAGARSALVRVPLSGVGPWEGKVSVGTAPEGLSASVVIPASPANALVSDPTLYRATPSPRSPLWPSATHLFTRNDRVHIEWTPAGPLDNRTARLLDRRGQPLAVGITLSEPPGGAVLAGDVSLAPLAPGDYLIELVASRGTASERHLVAIRIQ
jgi:VWFA-related protein